MKMGEIVRMLLILLLFEFDAVFTNICARNGPLGMITGQIQDWQITASSTYPSEWDKGCDEKYARIYLPNKLGWCAKYKSPSEWLQVDLGVAARVTGVMTQGRGDGAEWVTSYTVSYSMDGFHWMYIRDQYGNNQVFEGNSDSFTVKHSYLDAPIIARYIKFHTKLWHRHPSMRVEILGCQLCKEPVGLPPYGKVTVSTYKNYKSSSSCLPDDGNILSNKAWCAKKQRDNQWLQIDVGPPTLITGLITKGRADTSKKHWVTRYKISYSNDTFQWYFYKDSHYLDTHARNQWLWTAPVNSSASKLIPDMFSEDGLLFGGNTDKHSERIHYLNSPFVARFVRFHPVEWHGKISMRAGLLGCPYAGYCNDGFMRVNDDSPCIENLAFRKDTWINRDKATHKRKARHNKPRANQASRAVDGNKQSSLQTCTILDNLYGKNPVWILDLGQKRKISGIIIYTWQDTSHDKGHTLKEYMSNLDKLVMYISNRLDEEDDHLASRNMCGYISRLNGALTLPKLHVPCIKPQEGRFILIEAWGIANSWSRLFSAVLCEVMLYS